MWFQSEARCTLFAYGLADATASENPIISCLNKIQTGFTLLVLAYLDCPGKEAAIQYEVQKSSWNEPPPPSQSCQVVRLFFDPGTQLLLLCMCVVINEESIEKLTNSCQLTGKIETVLVICSPMIKMLMSRLTMHVNTMSRICHAYGKLM